MATDALRAQVAARWQESFSRLNRNQPGITGLLEVSQAWNLAARFLYPRDISDPSSHSNLDMKTVRRAFEVLSKSRMLSYLLENFLEDMRKQQHFITTEIVGYMARHESHAEDASPADAANLIARLVEWYDAWRPLTELGTTINGAYTLAFQTHVFAALPASFPSAFKQLIAWTLSPSSYELSPPLQISQIWANCESLGLIDRYETLIASVCYEHIEGHVMRECKDNWREPMLTGLRDWMANTVVPWMLMPYARGAKTTDDARQMLQGVGSRFDFHICKTLCDLRTQEIFDIIVDFPASTGALQDLRECLQRVDQRTELVKSLRAANKKRLLHPGADTRTIIEQYVLMIKSLRFIDPLGVLLYKVADPIRRYLRDRPDTIRTIVGSLVGDDDIGESLLDDNEPIQPLQQPEAEDYSDPNWEPEPIDAGPDFRSNKPSDVVSTLVSIYDSKELFVKEYQVLLARRLVGIKDGNFTQERRNIEILKIRFGEVALQVCEVMLRDMTDSRRTDQHVQAQEESVLHPTIISQHFWPALAAGNLVVPPKLKAIQDQYAKEFSKFKPDKRLRWLGHLGSVSMDVELQDRTISVDVEPIDAAVLELFSEQPAWSADELVKRLGLKDRADLTRPLNMWIDHGVLKEEADDTYVLLEIADANAPERDRGAIARAAAMAEEVPAVQTVQQQQAEQMKVYWMYIEGMLKNLGALPLDRIQSMLRLAQGYDRTIEQLDMFMDAARREGLVVNVDGKWRLNKT